MKKVIASAGLLALGAVGIHDARADWAAGPDKPWSISGSLRGFYDDNVNTQPDDSGRESSFGLVLSPSIQTSLSSGPTTFTASYAYGLTYYENRTPNKFDQSHDLELFLNHNFNERYSLDFEESFIDSQEPEVLNPSGGGGVLRANGDNYRNVAGFHFTDQVTQLLSLVLGYSNTFYDYTGNLPDQLSGLPNYSTELNRFEHLVILNARWQVAEETTAVFGYNFGLVNYIGGGSLSPASVPNPPGFGPLNPYIAASVNDNISHYIYAGVDHNFRSDLSLSVRAGVQVSDYYNYNNSQNAGGNDPSSISPYASLNVNYTYMDGGVFTLGFTHSKNVSDQKIGANNSVTPDQESSVVSGTIVQTLTPLSPDLTATATAMYQNSAYDGGGLDGLADNSYDFGFSLNYQLTHYVSFQTGYNYDLLVSQVPSRGYNRDRVYIGVTATY